MLQRAAADSLGEYVMRFWRADNRANTKQVKVPSLEDEGSQWTACSGRTAGKKAVGA